MTFVTPVDGQPALASHVSQITDTLVGTRAETITLAGNLIRNGPDLTDRTISFQTNGANRWRMGIIDTQAEGTPDVGGDFKLQYYWNSGGPRTLVTIDRDVGKWSFTPDTNIPVNVTGQMEVVSGFTNAVTIRNTTAANADRWEIGSYQIKGYGYGEAYPRLELDSASGMIRFTYGDLNPSARIAMTGTGSLQFYADNGQGIHPLNTAQNDLGTTGNRWRKLWATDAEFTNAPTINGVALSSTYLPLAGGTLTGDLQVNKTSPQVTLKATADTQPRIILDQQGIYAGPGGSSGVDIMLLRTSPLTWTLHGHLNTGTTNTYDLGAISSRYRSGFFGTVVSIAGSSATANQITTAITTDAQPRLQIDGNGYMKWGPGATTPYDTTLQRTGVGALRIDNYLGVGAAPLAWNTVNRVVQVGTQSAVVAYSSGTGLGLWENTYLTAGSLESSVASGGATKLMMVSGTTSLYTAPSVGALTVQTFTKRLSVDVAGNVMLGTPTPNAWFSSNKALQFHGGGAVVGHDGNGSLRLINNTYQDASAVYRAVQTGAASMLELESAGHLSFSTAASVSGGATQTFAMRMYLNSSGMLQLYPTAGSAGIYIGGTAQPKITVASTAPSSPMTGDLWIW